MPARNASTHERLRTSAHPSRRLARKWSVVAAGSSADSTSWTTRGRNGTSSTTETTNVAASKRSATPGPPPNPISSPAASGPTIAPTE